MPLEPEINCGLLPCWQRCGSSQRSRTSTLVSANWPCTRSASTCANTAGSASGAKAILEVRTSATVQLGGWQYAVCLMILWELLLDLPVGISILLKRPCVALLRREDCRTERLELRGQNIIAEATVQEFSKFFVRGMVGLGQVRNDEIRVGFVSGLSRQKVGKFRDVSVRLLPQRFQT